MADGRKCAGPECENPLTGTRRQKYCSDACRHRAAVRRRSGGSGYRTVGELSDAEGEAAARRIIEDELRPVVREAITADVVDSINALVKALPAAIQAAANDVGSSDPELRQRAYALILKHTIGNNAITPDISGEKNQPLTVHFNLPRPSGNQNGADPDAPSGVIESKDCDSCGVHKPVDQFVGSSDRCQECFDKMRTEATRMLGEGAVVQDAG